MQDFTLQQIRYADSATPYGVELPAKQNACELIAPDKEPNVTLRRGGVVVPAESGRVRRRTTSSRDAP